MHEWVKGADTGYGFGDVGALEASSKTIMTSGGLCEVGGVGGRR